MPDYPKDRGSKAERIRELHAKGLPKATIAARVGCSYPTVVRALTPEKAADHRDAQARYEKRKQAHHCRPA